MPTPGGPVRSRIYLGTPRNARPCRALAEADAPTRRGGRAMIRTITTVLILAAGAIALAAVAPWAGAAVPPSGPVIGIENFTFGESTLTIPAGTTVTWVNH